MLGVFCLNPNGLSGGLLQMINHGLSTGALFLLVGFVYERRHTRRIDDFGGLGRVAPMLATAFVVTALGQDQAAFVIATICGPEHSTCGQVAVFDPFNELG